MLDGKELSKLIRARKKDKLRPDMDDAGQEAVDPNAAFDAHQGAMVNTILKNPDHEPASDAEMGENESSQEIPELKKSVARIEKYMKSMMIR